MQVPLLSLGAAGKLAHLIMLVTLLQVVQNGGLVQVTEACQVVDAIQDGRIGGHH